MSYEEPVTWELNMHRELSKEIVLERTTVEMHEEYGSSVSIGYRYGSVASINIHTSILDKM